MMTNPPRQYFDANIFIAVLKQETIDGHERWRHCQQLLQEAEARRCIAVTSTMTIAEVTGGRPRPLPVHTKVAVRSLFGNDWLVLVGTDRFVAESARELIWEFPTLRPIDAIHLASALSAGCEVLYTYDENHLLKLSGRSDIRIERPLFTGAVQEPLPEPSPRET